MLETIILAVLEELPGVFLQGTNFQKGDYIERPRYINATTSTGRNVELNRTKVLNVVGGQRVTNNKLSKLVGQDVNKFI